MTVAAGSPVTIGLDPALRAVVFDLDGVITDTAEHHYRAWKRLAPRSRSRSTASSTSGSRA